MEANLLDLLKKANEAEKTVLVLLTQNEERQKRLKEYEAECAKFNCTPETLDDKIKELEDHLEKTGCLLASLLETFEENVKNVEG